jgi:hypothetical protein
MTSSPAFLHLIGEVLSLFSDSVGTPRGGDLYGNAVHELHRLPARRCLHALPVLAGFGMHVPHLCSRNGLLGVRWLPPGRRLHQLSVLPGFGMHLLHL